MSAPSWTIRIPAPAPWINANQREHRLAIRQNVKLWRDAGNVYARQAKLPTLGQARVRATLHFPDKRRRDDHNYFLTIKALIDGMIDYGFLADDSSEYLVGVELCGGVPLVDLRSYGRIGMVELLVSEVR